MKKQIIFTIILIMLVACSMAFAMDEENYLSDKKLSTYSSIVINDFDLKNVDIEHIDADEMKILEPMLPSLANMLSESIKNELKKEKLFRNIYVNEKKLAGAVKLEGRFIKLNGGIGGVKYVLGFMAPKNTKTHIAIAGRLVDAESGIELATFEHTNFGTVYFKNFADYFPEMSVELGESIADFIKDNY